MSIIIKPIITEKATKQSELSNCHTFFVNTNANKIQIKKAIELQYGVSVLNVNTLVIRADRTTKFTKNGLISGKTNVFKKAFVQLKDGESIDFYNNI
jgi:large subunit ribosomal protein L23